MRQLAFIAFVSIFLTGCAGSWGIRRPVSDSELEQVHRLGVGSILGHDFHMFHQGYTVFGNERSISTVDWDVDAFVVDTSLTLLKGNSKIESAAIDIAPPPRKSPKIWKDETLWDTARRQGFDHLLIFTPGVSQNMALFPPGIGFYEMGMFGGWRCVYAGYVANVYSVATHEIVGWQWAIEYPCNRKSSNDIPYRPSFDDYSADEKAKIHERLSERLVESLDFVIEKVDLAPGRGAGR